MEKVERTSKFQTIIDEFGESEIGSNFVGKFCAIKNTSIKLNNVSYNEPKRVKRP